MQFTSYDGVSFSSISWDAALSDTDARGQWAVSTNIAPRTGNTTILSPGAISPRRIPIEFVYYGAADMRLGIDQLMGYLNPRDQTPKLLVAARYDATVVQRYARVESVDLSDSAGSLNVIRAVFVSEDPEWVKSTSTTVDQTGAVSPFSSAITNAGQTPVHPVYQVRWTVQRVTKGVVVGQQYRKRMTLINTQTRTLAAFPYRIDLGDTAALVTATKAQSDGDDLRIVIDGKDMTRRLIGWNLVQSFAWIVIPGMDALEVLTIDIVYGNASATTATDWVDPDPDKPIIDISTESGTATGGSTTTLIKATAAWQTDQWYRGDLYMLTGANAGLFRTITANNGTTLTVNAFPNAIVNTDTFLITMSSNDRWIYSTRQINRESDYARGRWYVNSPRLTPSVVSFESPGAWRLELIMDNRDSMGAKRFSMIDSGGDKDPFTLLDAQRMWEGNDNNVFNPGTADGVAITTPVPIDSMYWEYQFDNPNAMVKAWIGVRASGAEDWAEAYADDAATSGLTTIATQFVNIQPDFGDVYQVAQALLPVNDIEIGLEWRRDTGSLSSATTTVSTDSSQEWSTDQYDNGSILMLSGVNKGIKRSITSNTATAITHAAFPAASADGDRYVVQNKRLKGLLRDGSKLALNLDDTFLTASALGSETAVYEASMTIWVGDGPAGSPTGQHRALIGYAAGSKRLFLAADERVEVDADLRKIRIYNTTSSTYTATLTDPTVIVQWHDGTDWQRTADFLPLGMGDQLVWLEETNIGTLGIETEYFPKFLGP